MGDFSSHQELKRILRAGIIAKVDEPLVDNFGPCFGRDVAAEVNVKLAGNLEIISRPWVSLRIEQIDPSASCDGDERVGFGSLPIEF